MEIAPTSPSRAALAGRATARTIAFVLVLGLLLFVPAGTLDWPRAWVYLGAICGLSVPVTAWLLLKHPALLERRMRSHEARPDQRRVIRWLSLALLGMYVVPGLGRRFGWPELPDLVSYAADVGIVLSYLMVVWVFATNEFASRVVEIDAGQAVIDTGPYAWVRHPMYGAALVMLVLTPIALGSGYALLFALPMPIALWRRAEDEEELLRAELPGYGEYAQRVRWRFFPFLL
jgi:protein-S-isoprenylcysteine O-methyltransferase Ste14